MIGNSVISKRIRTIWLIASLYQDFVILRVDCKLFASWWHPYCWPNTIPISTIHKKILFFFLKIISQDMLMEDHTTEKFILHMIWLSITIISYTHVITTEFFAKTISNNIEQSGIIILISINALYLLSVNDSSIIRLYQTLNIYSFSLRKLFYNFFFRNYNREPPHLI